MAATLLVGIDGSECAERAADLAVKYAELVGAKVHLLAVIEWSRYGFYTPEELETRSRDREEEKKKANAVLTPLKERLGSSVDIETSVHFGHAANVLKGVAQEEEISQIFIGRHGRSRFETALFGSVTNRILQSAPVPVTVVP